MTTMALKSTSPPRTCTSACQSHTRIFKPARINTQRRKLAITCSAVDDTTTATQPSTSTPTTFDFTCPICHSTAFQLQNLNGKPTGSTSCPRCNRTFDKSSSFIDLTLTSGIKPRAFNTTKWGGTELFRNPLVSLAYERGWRAGFAWAGFPGVDKEFEKAMEMFKPAYGQVIVDMSCGSGLFSRRFLASKKFAGVVAADFSESMLNEAKTYFDQDAALDSNKYILARMDVGRLPFATGSVAAIHAGAALHCWPDPQNAFAEISRVLRPGGVFLGTTFLKAAAPLGEIVGDEVIRPLNSVLDRVSGTGTQNMRWYEEQEIRDLGAAVGLGGFEKERSFRFILFSMTKPNM